MDGKLIAIRTLIQTAVAALVVLLVLLVLHAAEFFLVIFGGILFAVLFHGIAHWVSKKTRLPEQWALAVSLLAPLLLIGLGIWLIAPSVSSQAAELADRLPEAARQLQQRLLQYEWVEQLRQQTERLQQALPSGSRAAGFAAGFFTSTFGALGNLILALAVGLFLSINPGLYMRGLLHLFPIERRKRAAEVLRETGSTLRSWLIAKIFEMMVIGVLTTIGLWLIGIDLALVLGVIAAILSFVPNIGPVVAVIPAALIALISGPDQLLYVILLYVGIQTLESYLLTPMLQQHMVDMPPALTVSMQVLLGILVGILGVIVATPLTAAAMVMIKMWYVEDLLGDKSAQSDS